jgi:hypothetical protein
LSNEEQRILQASSGSSSDVVVVDFRALLEKGVDAFDSPLYAGDELEIPEMQNEVLVVGAVTNPGIVPYEGKQSLSHYLQLAGGLQRRADKGNIAVFKANRLVQMDARENTRLEPGDAIVVSYRRRIGWRELLQSTSAVVTTITGLYFTLHTLLGN